MGLSHYARIIMVEALFDDSKFAIFERGHQVTPWRVYQLGQPVPVDKRMTLPELEIRSSGAWIRFPCRTTVEPGDVLIPPPLDEWIEVG